MMNTLAIALLTFNVAVCTLGLFSCWYKDTFLQTLGMTLMGLVSGAYLYQVMAYGYISHNAFATALAVSLYGLGTVFKTLKNTKKFRQRLKERRL